MQTFIVIIITAIAVLYLGRRFYSSLKPTETNNCGCGCNGCSEASTCEEPFVTLKEP